MPKHFLRMCVTLLLVTVAAAQGPRELKAGWNLFSKDQDIQLGKEAAAQVEKEYTVVRDADLVNYVRRVGAKLAATPEAGGFPYSFQVVADKSINAFALPGGPAFVHTGLVAAADNEAQLAGVLAHEISHVALRHGTNQASKANLIQLPVLLASGMLGKSSSMLGQLAQLGIGLGANSVLLKFSRSAEADADLLGTRIMAKAGYNPLEMARFFEKLEASGGTRGPQFLSDHPNPGNRVKAVEEEIRYLPQSNYTLGNTGEFTRMQRLSAAVPVLPSKAAGTAQPSAPPAVGQIPVSKTFREYRTSVYTISYPDNWQITGGETSPEVSLVPKEGYVRSPDGTTSIGIGAVIDFAQNTGDLGRDTDDLVRQLMAGNTEMRVAETSKSGRVNGQPAMITVLQARSPFAGETEVDTLVTVSRPQGLFFVVLIAPQSMARDLDATFNTVLRSLRF